VGVEIAGDPAAAMEEHHGRRFFSGNAIDPRRQRARRALYAYVSHGAYRRRRHMRAGCCQRTKRIAGALRGHDRRIAQRQQRNDVGNHGIERCGHAKTLKARGCAGCISIVSPSGAGNRACGISHQQSALRDQHSQRGKLCISCSQLRTPLANDFTACHLRDHNVVASDDTEMIHLPRSTARTRRRRAT
jgi:hypothetical protein